MHTLLLTGFDSVRSVPIGCTRMEGNAIIVIVTFKVSLAGGHSLVSPEREMWREGRENRSSRLKFFNSLSAF